MAVFMKAARTIGDLDDEFYHDERQRDVWNEASAVGFQLAQWAALAGAAFCPGSPDVSVLRSRSAFWPCGSSSR